jgi:ketose-bisphosphate aldolase
MKAAAWNGREEVRVEKVKDSPAPPAALPAPCMTTLREVLAEADRTGVAVGHFNISELVALKGVSDVARELKVPVLIGMSESERNFIGVRQAVALVHSIRDEFGQPIFLSADHTHSLIEALEVARAGFDAVVFDLSDKPIDQNFRSTREAVEAIKQINSSILVEGEIGYIGSGSAIHERAPESVLTTPEEAAQFIASTGVDVLAPAVGNMHGLLRSMVSGETQKRLNIARIREIKQATGIFLTLHGGSGTNDDDLRQAIQAGITVVHINTEIRLAWRRGLAEALTQHPDEIAPYKILPAALEAVKNVVRARLQLFAGRTVVSARG